MLLYASSRISGTKTLQHQVLCYKPEAAAFPHLIYSVARRNFAHELPLIQFLWIILSLDISPYQGASLLGGGPEGKTSRYLKHYQFFFAFVTALTSRLVVCIVPLSLCNYTGSHLSTRLLKSTLTYQLFPVNIQFVSCLTGGSQNTLWSSHSCCAYVNV